MRRLFALALLLLALLLVTFLLLVRPAWAGTTHRTTDEEPTLGRLQTRCDDGTRAASTYHQTLDRWETTVTERRKPVCTVWMDPTTQQIRVRCR